MWTAWLDRSPLEPPYIGPDGLIPQDMVYVDYMDAVFHRARGASVGFEISRLWVRIAGRLLFSGFSPVRMGVYSLQMLQRR